MRRFLWRITVFSVAFFLMEKFFFVFLLVSPNLEADRRLEQIILGEMNHDVVIFGSSRGSRNIIAEQIQDSLGFTTYNLSYPGSDIEFHEFLLRSLLEFNKSPKAVVLAVDDPTELMFEESITFRYDRLYPLAKYNHINKEMAVRGEKSFLSYFLVLARINRSNFDLRKKHFSELDSVYSCGSMPVSIHREDRPWVYDSSSSYNQEFEMPQKIDAFTNFLNICSANDIELFLVFSPNYKSHNLFFENRIRDLAEESANFVIYNTLNDLYKEKSYFYDESHLLKDGAVVFTNEIIEDLRSYRF